jgi:hypothetical protein
MQASGPRLARLLASLRSEPPHRMASAGIRRLAEHGAASGPAKALQLAGKVALVTGGGSGVGKVATPARAPATGHYTFAHLYHRAFPTTRRGVGS